VKMFDAGKTRMIGLPCGEKTVTICGGTSRAQTDKIAISLSCVSVLTRDKNFRQKQYVHTCTLISVVSTVTIRPTVQWFCSIIPLNGFGFVGELTIGWSILFITVSYFTFSRQKNLKGQKAYSKYKHNIVYVTYLNEINNS